MILFFDSRQSNVTAIKIPDVKISGGWCYLFCGVSSLLVNTKFNMKNKNSRSNHLCTLGCLINEEVLMNGQVGLTLSSKNQWRGWTNFQFFTWNTVRRMDKLSELINVPFITLNYLPKSTREGLNCCILLFICTSSTIGTLKDVRGGLQTAACGSHFSHRNYKNSSSKNVCAYFHTGTI